MSKPTDIRLTSVTADTETIDYRTPMKFGGRVVTEVTLLNVRVEVETRQGKQASGYGSMPIGNAWGWPSQLVSSSETLQAMIETGRRIAAAAGQLGAIGHPLELTHALAADYQSTADAVTTEATLAEPMPRLAVLVAASPLEAAVHDAYGHAHGQNSYNLLGAEYANTDLAHYLTADFAGEYLDAYTLREPKPSMPLYHLVGALDPLTDGDLSARVDDGLPETLFEWIMADELTHLKIKLAGDDLAWDVARVAAVEAAALQAQNKSGCKQWHYSLDFNERCQSVQYVLDFLAKLKETAPAAWERVQYIEQPTHRDLRSNPENCMHEAAKVKPVVIDESLIDLDSLLLAREQGYSGVALKACKGHSEALLMGAAAQKLDMFLCVQDLTCPGYSFLHSASIAARLPGIAAIEGNGRQYCPAGNVAWREVYPTMFDIRGGQVGTGVLVENGLGFAAPRR